MTDLTDLIARLEAATGPSRELDAEIARAVLASGGTVRLLGMSDDEPSVSIFCYPNGSNGTALNYTGSIDAALTALPEGWSPEQITWGEDGKSCVASVGNHGKGSEYKTGQSEICPTPALALITAIMKARAA